MRPLFWRSLHDPSKVARKRDARAELLFCSLNLPGVAFLTFPLPSPSCFRTAGNTSAFAGQDYSEHSHIFSTTAFSEYVGHSFRQKFCFREENLFLNGRKVRENSLILELIFDWMIDKQINAEHGPRPPTGQILPFVTKINYTSYLTSILIKMI